MQKIIQIQAKQTYKLRLEVLKTCDAYIYRYKGDFDATTMHFGAFLDNINIGIVTLMENNHDYFSGKQIQLRGMAITKSAQGKKIGEKLILAFKEESIKRNATVIWCNARDYSVEFYKKQGFKIKGNKFYIENVCDHYVMYFKLNE